MDRMMSPYHHAVRPRREDLLGSAVEAHVDVVLVAAKHYLAALVVGAQADI